MSSQLLSSSGITAAHGQGIKLGAANKGAKATKDTVSRYTGNSLAHKHLDKEEQIFEQMLDNISQFGDRIQEIGINFDLMDLDIASKIN